MKHRISYRKLSKNSAHRKAMFGNMVTSLFSKEQITTTDAKAKELRRICEPLITRAKNDTLHNRRMVYRVVRDTSILKKLFEDIALRYKKRPGGYTRIIKVGQRQGDDASTVIIQLVEELLGEQSEKGDIAIKATAKEGDKSATVTTS